MKTSRLHARHGFSTAGYLGLIALFAAATFGVLLLYQNIVARKAEATKDVFRVVEVGEGTVDPLLWGKNYPRQYDSYRRTVDTERTNHGGSEAFQHLDQDPAWRRIFAGNPFSIDYREERGHAYMLSDQRETERVTKRPQPGACLHCHASALKAYVDAGIRAGVPAGKEHWEQQIQKGFEEISPLPYADATKLVEHPVSCIDCHDAETMNLRVNRPGFLNGIRALAKSDYPTPHLPSIERWRRDGRQGQYEPNKDATRQEMRSMVCAQCHVEYHFKGDKKLVTFPWDKGLKVEQIEAYYNEAGFKDWVHKETGAPSLKAQHPEFELWSQGIHARAGVSCSDCHMPYVREGAVKVSNHHVRSPLLNVAQACQTCHRVPEKEIKDRALLVQDRNASLLSRGEKALVGLIDAIVAAQKAGATDTQLKAARSLQRQAQWRLDFVAAENSMGFHAPQEAARILAEAIDYARQGELAVARDTKPAAGAP
ncbi:MAG: ammonia-forming cytochrome c nitrite reductase subunit c552 [Opitutus sp.]|nr:ammonia-forming cytochrome c nitrite reductase subunit c552 [Opitutus sp.]